MDNLSLDKNALLLRSIHDRIKTLNNEIEVLTTERDQLIQLASDYINDTPVSNKSNETKKRESLLRGQNFTWKTEAIEILKNKIKFLTTDEIYQEFIITHPEFNDQEKRKNIQASFSSALSQLAEKDEIVRIDRKFAKGNLWGLPDWFDSSGMPFPAFRDQLSKQQIVDFIYMRVNSKD